MKEITEEMIYECFAAARQGNALPETAESFVDVEEYENQVMYPEFARWAEQAGRGEDTQRAIDALETIRANCDQLIGLNPDGVIEKALRVAMRVEEREYSDIYPYFRDQALEANSQQEAAVYQKVIDSERQHYDWFRNAMQEYFPQAATPATA
jgi:hypothetical protein